MVSIDQYTILKQLHICRIQHIEATGDLESLDHVMRKFNKFLARWTRLGIHKERVAV